MMRVYVKAPAVLVKESIKPVQIEPVRRGGVRRLIPLVLMGIGSFLVVFVSAPIITYELVSAPSLRQTKWLSPVIEGGVRTEPRIKGTATVVQAQEVEVDYTQVSNWFPSAPAAEVRQSKITHYTVDIPQLNIKNAVVTVGGNDLKESLVHYGGTANPGEFGTPVIFGHSILRQFYNPREDNPHRYMSIFSTIMTLTAGDKIYVNYDGIKYTYTVKKKYQVEPTNVEVLAQYYDQKILRLVTCVPEGTYLHRGVIEAVLEPTD